MNVKNDFPFLAKNIDLVYLDSACTSIKPKQVIEAEKSYYEDYGACAGRSSHKFGAKTSEKIENCREIVAGFVGAKSENLIWTRNTTEGLNLVANCTDFQKRKTVVTTINEHHSVLLPLLKLRDTGKIKLKVLKAENGVVSLEQWSDAIDKETALVVTHNSNNTTSIKQNVKQIAEIVHDAGALICIDGAQGVPHYAVDFGQENFDFLCFSGHKMLGSTGIGALVAKTELLKSMPQFLVGGGTVKTVSLEKVVVASDQSKFEAGIQHYAGIFGFAAACEYLKKIGMKNIEAHEKTLSTALLSELKNANATVYGDLNNRGALYSFNLGNAAPHELALMLDKEGIAVRSGFFCAQPAMESLGAKNGCARVSAYVYNSLEDVKKFGNALKKLSELYC